MIKFNSDNSKKNIFIIVLVLIWIMFPVYLSSEKWKEQPKRIQCDYFGQNCKISTYNYEHKICWNALYISRHRSSNCIIPKILTEENELFKLNNISEVTIVPADNSYKVEIVSKEGDAIVIAKNKKERDAIHLSKLLDASIKKWQQYKPDFYTEDRNSIFDYNFVEYKY